MQHEVVYGRVSGDLLQELLLRLEFIFLPALRAQKNWTRAPSGTDGDYEGAPTKGEGGRGVSEGVWGVVV